MKFERMSLICLSLLGTTAAGRAETNPPPRLLPLPTTIWKAGDTWPLMVEYSSPQVRSTASRGTKDPSKDPHPVRYEMAVIVTPLSTLNVPAWRVAFLVPRENAPAAVGQQGGMTVRKEDGSVVAACTEHFEGPIRHVDWAVSIQRIGEVDVVANPPEGFPMDVFFAAMDYDQTEFVGANGRLTMKKEQSGKQITLEAAYKPDKGEELRVRQVWRQGEKWWRVFERYRDGKQELRAWIPDDYFAQQEEKERRPAVPNKELPAAREDECELRGDPRLRVPLNLQLQQPTVEQVLQHLRGATQVDLERDPELDGGTLAFGSLALTNVPAWQVMMQLAACPSVAGRWQKTDTGYHLIATSSRSHRSTRVLRVWFGALSLVLLVAFLARLNGRRRQSQGVNGASGGQMVPKSPPSI